MDPHVVRIRCLESYFSMGQIRDPKDLEFHEFCFEIQTLDLLTDMASISGQSLLLFWSKIAHQMAVIKQTGLCYLEGD